MDSHSSPAAKDCKSADSIKESKEKTKDKKSTTSSESTDSNGVSHKSKPSKSSVELKANGNSTAPKRDLTTPTKSSSAKAKPVAPTKKPLPTLLKKEKIEPVKKTEKPSKNKSSSSESLEETKANSNKEKTAPSKDKKVNEKDKLVIDKDKPVSDKDKPVSDRDKPVSDKDEPVSNKDKPVSNKDEPVSDKDEPVSNKDKSASDKDKPVSDKDKPVSDKDEPVSDKDEPVSNKDKPVSNKDEPVNEKSVCGKTGQSTSDSLNSSKSTPAVTPSLQTSSTNDDHTANHTIKPIETVDQTAESSPHISSVNTKHSMATCDPHTIGEINPETTERMQISKGKVKYINLTYKKVEAKIYDYKCDVKLLVGKEHFRAHRDVLSEASDYFAAMFSHDMKEKGQDTIELKEISPKGITVMLDYFYHGYITVDTTNIEDIIEAARFFHVEWILEASCDFLVQCMSVENYPAVLMMTDKYSLGDLRFEILLLFGQNLEALSKEDDFYTNLSYELLLQFLMDDIYIECSEYFLVQVLLKWLAVDPRGRKDQFQTLLRQIRFFLMEAEELEALPEEVTSVSELKEEIEAAINHNLNIMGQCLKTGEKYLPRGCRSVATIFSFTEEGYFIIYRDPGKPGITMEQLGPCGLDTTDYMAMSQAKLGNFLYAAGGYDENFSSTARMFRFDPRFRDWTEVTPMNQPRVSFCLCSSDRQLFAVGGVHRIHIDDDNEPETILDSVEIYSPQDNQWTNATSMPIKVFDMAAAYCNGSLYICGGISADARHPCPLRLHYSLKLGGDEEWVKCSDMITSRQGHSLTPYKGKLYAVGGYCMPDNNFRECVENEVYDIETDQWTQFTHIPIEYGHLYRHNGIHNGVIFCIGGNTPDACLFMYDIEADKWEEVEQVGSNVQKLAVLDVAYP